MTIYRITELCGKGIHAKIHASSKEEAIKKFRMEYPEAGERLLIRYEAWDFVGIA